MKRIINLLLILCLILTFASCKKSKDIISDISSAAPSVVSSQTLTSSEEKEETSSQPEVSSSTPVVSAPAPTVSSSSQVTSSYELKNYDITVGEYTVIDAENARGLSNEKSGFGFGVAKNGVAHSISFGNQARFDAMPNVEALALDTKNQDKRMYLTFDCGYEYKNLTANILDTLKEKNVKAAFFVTLDYLENNPQFVQRMIDEGHIVGNHSATHPVFPDISRTKMAEELYRVDEYLQKHFNYKTTYFRFPTGANSENSLELVTSIGYKSIFWSLAYGDYDTSNQMGYDKAYKTVTDRFHSGAVILLHAISQDNADILGAVIDTAHSQGYTFKTLDDYYTQ